MLFLQIKFTGLWLSFYLCIIYVFIYLFIYLLLQVKYTQDHKQMKGRPCVILDTPALRHVKEAQNHVSMVGGNGSLCP